MPQSTASTCEFCEELRTPTSSRFFRIYGPSRRHRIVARHGPFIAMPTIGQMFAGSLLVLTVEHCERFSDLPDAVLMELPPFLDRLKQSVAAASGASRSVVMFEHGARSLSRGGCGIYHAHIHIVPVPWDVEWRKVLPEGLATPTLVTAMRQLRTTGEYLLFKDSNGDVAYVDSSASGAYGSQYFRRILATCFEISEPWDWRAYSEPEQKLVDTILHFGDDDVPDRR